MDATSTSFRQSGHATGVLGEQLLELTARSPRMQLRDEDAVRLSLMEPFSFGGDRQRQAWSVGTGPLIVLVHGWGGIGAQMAPIAFALAAAGFRCVLFDALGHGQSADGKVGFDTFSTDTAALCRQLGEPLYALIGHSAGGLGMMAARYLHGLAARHYICLAVPLFPYVPIESLKAKFGFEEQRLESLKPLLAAQLERSWDELAKGAVFAGAPDGELVLIYDRDDPRVRHMDADSIASIWVGSKIVKTTGLGHNRILQDPQVIASIDVLLRELPFSGAANTVARSDRAAADNKME